VKTEQLQGLFKSLKIGFWNRLVICFALILCISIFNAFTYSLIRITACLATLVFAELFVYCYVPFYIDNLKLILRNKSVERPFPDEIKLLARSMGLKISKMKIVPKVCNAYARGKQVFVGEKLLEKLDIEQIKAVIAHEFGHIKGHHALVQVFYMLPFFAFLCLTWSQLPPAMLQIGTIAYTMVALVPVHWLLEKKADLTAVKYVGKEPLKSALLTLVEKDKLNEPSETHPPVNKRLKWIDEAEV